MITLTIPDYIESTNARSMLLLEDVSVSDVFKIEATGSFTVDMKKDEFERRYPHLIRYMSVPAVEQIEYNWDTVKSVTETKTKQLPNPWYAYIPYTDRKFKFTTIRNGTVCIVVTDYGISVYVAESVNKLMRMSTDIERLFTELAKTDLHDGSVKAYTMPKDNFEERLKLVKAKLEQYV